MTLKPNVSSAQNPRRYCSASPSSPARRKSESSTCWPIDFSAPCLRVRESSRVCIMFTFKVQPCFVSILLRRHLLNPSAFSPTLQLHTKSYALAASSAVSNKSTSSPASIHFSSPEMKLTTIFVEPAAYGVDASLQRLAEQ
eukprot:766416-Hanusia_phi.AAC.2